MNQANPRAYVDDRGRNCIDTTTPWYVLQPSEGTLLGYAGPLLIAENKIMRFRDRIELEASEWVYSFACGVSRHEWQKVENTRLTSVIEANVTNCVGFRPISEKPRKTEPLLSEQQMGADQLRLQHHLLAMDLTVWTNRHIRGLAREPARYSGSPENLAQNQPRRPENEEAGGGNVYFL